MLFRLLSFYCPGLFSAEFTCPHNYVKCPGSYCIASHLVCDDVSHCLGSEDEQNCGKKSVTLLKLYNFRLPFYNHILRH